ncbi:hypothetical protein GCM10007938_42830 [Vibrio zhanjiangensis]|uniref:Uncharacterized protein n=1 Tax=Vibrio zhanjiangensis TaxID=1046128 RepID=A0ABQ6F4M6_9VIBR|nr:hypothetical protein [Vibrio zhanjiangensis]GLT20498.1 hypothetical protein GCM10007938_42830 [Vibrio zhanjiangensis]
MAQQNSPLTRSIVNPATSVSALDLESSPKNDSSLGFRVALGSDIRPVDLAACGFEMKQFVFYPSQFEVVSALIDTRFTVVDQSVGRQRVYAFVRNRI